MSRIYAQLAVQMVIFDHILPSDSSVKFSIIYHFRSFLTNHVPLLSNPPGHTLYFIFFRAPSQKVAVFNGCNGMLTWFVLCLAAMHWRAGTFQTISALYYKLDPFSGMHGGHFLTLGVLLSVLSGILSECFAIRRHRADQLHAPPDGHIHIVCTGLFIRYVLQYFTDSGLFFHIVRINRCCWSSRRPAASILHPLLIFALWVRVRVFAQ